ncbi:hypothetical protein [Nocardia anaemiae]|uniref:hypothetical protein n=1 Tax=Nocardia anaemiae TaxID=263910 RepID=UPI0007A497AB|nr:hypothetical protein [Nocardia anaemiae]
MKFGPGHPLAYPVSVTIGALVVCLAWAPFGDLDQVAALATVALGILGYTGFQLAMALGYLSNGLADIHPRRDTSGSDGGSRFRTNSGTDVSADTGREPEDSPGGRTVEIKRVRQQHRLVSRSWLEITENYRTRWLPVFFEPALLGMTEAEADVTDRSVDTATLHFYPSGKARTSEPPGRLIDNPSRPDPDAPILATDSARVRRRLLLDAQSTVAAPFVALMWVYVAAGGFMAFLAATSVAAATAIWLGAIRGSDPS